MVSLTRYGVKIDGSSLDVGQWAYETEVALLLEVMSHNTVGAALLWGLSTHGLSVMITPYVHLVCNAGAGGLPTGAYVQFTPSIFSTSSPLGCNHANSAGADPGEILFHELVHALRNTARKWRQGSIGGIAPSYENDEEFIALMLTNIYISERHRPLRRDIRGFVPLAQTSESTVKSAAKITLIEVVKRDHPEMFRRITRSSAKYNPLKLYAST